MSSLRLAFREVRRRRGRFGLLALAVGILIFLILFQQSLLGALVEQFVGAIRNQSADVLVYSEESRRSLDGSVIFPGVQEQVEAVEGVAEAGPLGQGTFTVTADGALADSVIFGYELGGPGEPTTLTKGRLPESPGEAVASAGDEAEGFDLGDNVRVEPDGEGITVVGLADDTNFNVLPTLFVDYSTFEQARLTQNPDAAGAFPSAVAVTTDGAPETVAERIAVEVPGTDPLTRDQAADEAPGVQSVQQSLSIVLVLVYVVVGLVSGFFFLILTVQKSQSLTLLRAVGASAWRLIFALLAQVVTVIVLGGVIGALLSWLALQGGGQGLGASLDPRATLIACTVVLAIAIVAAVGSMRRVLRLQPVAAADPEDL